MQDLRTSIATAKERNVKLLHIAEHGSRKYGFLFNANDAATASAEADIHALTDVIGVATGQNGPIECAVLNACSTAGMGQLLRAAGNLSHVVCWRTPVSDEAAREFCHHF
jgi:CHAT domain-containing protein